MFKRDLQKDLEKWCEQPLRKPLVIRGARQVGKTTVVSQLSKNFGQYIYPSRRPICEVPESLALTHKVPGVENFITPPIHSNRSDSPCKKYFQPVNRE